MPRKNRRYAQQLRPLPRDGGAYWGTQEETGPHGDIYLVRQIGSASAKKYYVCPRCNQNIPPGVAHVVAWPRDTGGRGDDRRHWHRHCWERR
ncbi:hypothetical protein [Corynebacterium urinipleomorphum]|uniref:hypothetical protein n=1 Tax=Corynebacterium urinipleomorphum TaxID=1852380 RepID=UPI000B35FAEF|nr:hypothetical protein [Corynebacterium urinipleomorphum]